MEVGALYSNTTGYYNTAYGLNALSSNTTGNDNTGVGADVVDLYAFSQGTFLGVFSFPNADGYSNVMGLGY